MYIVWGWGGSQPCSVEIDETAAVALGPKADSGIHFLPNLLVESMHMSYEKGLGLVRGAGTGYYAEGTATPGRHLIEPTPSSQPP